MGAHWHRLRTIEAADGVGFGVAAFRVGITNLILCLFTPPVAAVLVAFDAEELQEEAARTWNRALPNAIRWRPHAADTSEMLEEGMNLRIWMLCGIQAARIARDHPE